MIIHISGQPVLIADGSLSIDDAIEERATATFVVIDKAGTSHYKKGQPVHIWGDDDFLAFGGVIDSAQERRVTPSGVLFHTIRCVDWHYLADKRVAAASYENMAAGDIVQDLINEYLAAEGIITTVDVGFFSLHSAFYADFVDDHIYTIQTGPMIREMVINYRPVSEALDAIAEKSGFIWYIDQYKRLWFVDRAAHAAPWVATELDMRRGSVSVEHGNSKYRNRQYVKGGKDLTDPQIEIKPGDGESRSFTVGYPIGKVPTVEVDRGSGYVVETVGIKGVDSDKAWYWSKGDPILAQDESETVLAATDRLRITYQGEFDIIVLTQDDTAIVDRQQVEGGGTGWVEDVADEPNSTTSESAFQVANAKLKKYGVIGRRIRFQTHRHGLKPGQLLTVNRPDHDLHNVQMLIESISVQDEDDFMWYDVAAVEGPEQGSWAKMFAVMATRGQSFVERVNVGEDQILVLLVPFNDAWTWDETLSVDVFACPVPSVTTYPEVTLYPC